MKKLYICIFELYMVYTGVDYITSVPQFHSIQELYTDVDAYLLWMLQIIDEKIRRCMLIIYKNLDASKYNSDQILRGDI